MPRLSSVCGGISHLRFHTGRELMVTQNGDTALLWLTGWNSVFNISVGSNWWFIGAPVELTKSYFLHHKHTKWSWPSVLTPCCTTPMCQLGTEGCSGLGISPSNSPITHPGWGAGASTFPEKVLYCMQSLCKTLRSPWCSQETWFPQKNQSQSTLRRDTAVLPTKSSSPKSTAQSEQKFPPLPLQPISEPQTIWLKHETEDDLEMSLLFKLAQDTNFQIWQILKSSHPLNF